MIVLGLAAIGALTGLFAARKRRGNRKDMAQYAVGYAMAFAIVGMILTVVIERSVT